MPIDNSLVQKILKELGEPSFKYTGKGLIDQYRRPMVYLWEREGQLLHLGYSSIGFISCFKPSFHMKEVQENDRLIIWIMDSAKEAKRLKLELLKALGIEHN